MTAESFPITEWVCGNIERGPDLAVRVRRVVVADLDGEQEYIDVREYVPSSDTYGRGILVPAELKKPLLAALREA